MLPDMREAASGSALRSLMAAMATSTITANRSSMPRSALAALMASSTSTARRRNSTPAASPVMPLSSIDTQPSTSLLPPGNATAAATTGKNPNAPAKSSSDDRASSAVDRMRNARARWPTNTAVPPKRRSMVGLRLNASSSGPSGSHLLICLRG